MKLLHSIKLSFISLLKTWPGMVLTYLVLPIGLGLFMSMTMSVEYEPKIEDPNIEIAVHDEDNSATSKALYNLLISQELDPYVDFPESSKVDYTITIPKGFELQEGTLRIEGRASASRSQGAILEGILDQLIRTLNEKSRIETLLKNHGRDPRELQGLAQDVVEILNQKVYEQEKIEAPNVLTARQHYGVVMLAFLFTTFLSGWIQESSRKEGIGLRKRRGILPLSIAEATVMDILTGAIICMLFLGAYALIWTGIDPTIFPSNPLYYGVIMAAQSLMLSALAKLVGEVFSSKASLVIVQIVTIAFIVLSGMIPLETMTGLEVFRDIAQGNINALTTVPYFNLMRQNSIQSIGKESLILLGITVLLGGFTVLYLKKKREYKK